MSKKIILFFAGLLTVSTLMAQDNCIEINANNSGVFGIEYRLGSSFSFGARVNAGKMEASSVTPLVKYEVIQMDDASLYIGVGLRGLDPVNDISIPIGLRAKPFGNTSKLGFTLELENVFADDYFIIPTIGLSYRFGK